ncbi:MAG: gamma-glutamyl kinase, partial [Bdellovibrio sp.]
MQTFRTTQHLEQEKRKLFSSSSRILIKVGTAVLTNDDGSFDAKTFQHLCYQLAELKRAGKEIVLVTSGAIGFGKVLFNLEEPLTVSSQQSSAAAGQILLMGRYLEEFSKYDIKIAQLLLTRENFSDRKSLANLWGCISKLFYLGAIPIINENDVISSDELQHSTTFGDNDVLASMAAKSLIVGSILFLSDVDGLLDANGNLISY